MRVQIISKGPRRTIVLDGEFLDLGTTGYIKPDRRGILELSCEELARVRLGRAILLNRTAILISPPKAA